MHRGTDILVATPGRLLDLIDQKAFALNGVEILVLDEADQMLDLGFIHALKRINLLVPKERQTLFFSATMPKSIKDLAGQYCQDPVFVSVTPESTTAERIEQFLFMVQQDEKQTLLEMILKGRHPVPGKFERVLVFTRTKHGADRVVKKLGQVGIPANAIHGNKSQPQRERALDEFRRAKTPVLVATDVAARGIDIPGVSHVINYELPNVPEQYVHRIGRTARAGADGIAIAFCAEDERAYLKDIRKLTDAEFERLPLPDNFRAVVEGVGPTKREHQQKMARPKVTPKGAGRGEGRSSQVRTQPRREGEGQGQRREGGQGQQRREHGHGQPRREGGQQPRREGGQGQGGRPGGNRNRNRRRARG
ncbi:DEAD/DEAH box helicase [Leptolyngbya sp. 15MV]|nr:DEAD/DEAH box helicase [Leptolyngbya sp. 15MV]